MCCAIGFCNKLDNENILSGMVFDSFFYRIGSGFALRFEEYVGLDIYEVLG